MTTDFKADRVQSRMVNVSFNISCKAAVDNTTYQPCDATMLSLIKGNAVACVATRHSGNNENGEECHIKLNLPGKYSKDEKPLVVDIGSRHFSKMAC